MTAEPTPLTRKVLQGLYDETYRKEKEAQIKNKVLEIYEIILNKAKSCKETTYKLNISLYHNEDYYVYYNNSMLAHKSVQFPKQFLGFFLGELQKLFPDSKITFPEIGQDVNEGIDIFEPKLLKALETKKERHIALFVDWS